MQIHTSRKEFESCQDGSCEDDNCVFATRRAATLKQSAMPNPKRDDPDVVK